VFAAYETERKGASRAWVKIARNEINKILWNSWWHRFKVFTIPTMLGPLRLQKKYAAPFIAKAVRLDYVPFENERNGEIPWTFGQPEEPRPSSGRYGGWVLGFGALAVLFSVAIRVSGAKPALPWR
jgi:hypothetical protein